MGWRKRALGALLPVALAAQPGLSPLAAAQPQAPLAALDARVVALEARIGQLNTALQAAQRQAATPARNTAAAQRVALAALNLQAVLAVGRPWTREVQLLRDAASGADLPATLLDPLVSHAARGIPTLADLREGFQALTPALLDRASPDGGRLLRLWRQLLSLGGLADAPLPSAAEATLGNVSRLLAQGQLGPALADLETLDPPLQPLLAGWVAQARARVAAEQALQEIILRALKPAESN